MEVAIKKVEFKPHDFIEVTGITFPKYNDNMIVANGRNEFNCSWFWFSSLPKSLLEELNELINNTNLYLQERNVIPKRWPTGLLPKNTEEEYPFDFDIESYTIINKERNWSGDSRSHASVAARSKYFEPVLATVNLDFDISQNLFKELEKLL